jgi:hypothetical protein
MSETIETQEQELERLRAENEEFKKKKAKLRCQVSAKGALSVYGLGRFPVTLYRSQWESLLGMADVIKEFMVEHVAELPEKKIEGEG